jgi:hypothetical protein
VSHTQRARPCIDDLLAAFPGLIVRPVDEEIRLAPWWGWFGSGASLSSLSWQFEAGSAGERIGMAIARSSRLPYADLLRDLVAELSARSTPRFPLVIEREKQRIRVAGRNRVFVVLTAAHAAVSAAQFGEFTLTIRCPLKQLLGLELRAIERDELRGLDQLSAPTRAQPSE